MADGKLKTPSTDTPDIGDMRSKNDQSFEAFNAYATDQILMNLQENKNDGPPIDYESSPRRGQPQSILKKSKQSRLNNWTN